MKKKIGKRMVSWLSDIPAALVLPFALSWIGIWATRREHPNSMAAMDGALLPLICGLLLGMLIDAWRLGKRKQ